MLRVGLTGGLATGKSHIGRSLEQLGCRLIRADELGHEALAPDGAAYAGVREAFGESILRSDGSIDRRALASIVFGDPRRLELLNSIVHPVVVRREEEMLAQFAARQPGGIAVVEAAILIETGSYKRFDKIILAVCDEREQIERAMHRDRMSREDVLARLRRQMPLRDKLVYADYVVDTSGSREGTFEQVKRVFEQLRSIAQ